MGYFLNAMKNELSNSVVNSDNYSSSGFSLKIGSDKDGNKGYTGVMASLAVHTLSTGFTS